MGAFSRCRKLTFKNLIVLIIKSRSSIQRDLDRFYKVLNRGDFNIREVTKSAFTQARSKLEPWAFIRLNDVAVNTFYKEANYDVWGGLRVLAVDGTRLVLPNHSSIVEEFGQHDFGPKANSPRSLAMGSMLYDVLNQLTIDAQLAPYAASERDLLMKHLDKVKKGDLLLLDRGYPCYWLLFLLKAKSIEFCVRLKDDWWLKVKEFRESKEKECIVKFALPKKDRNKLVDFPQLQDGEIECRLVKVELSNGEIEVLCTSLLNSTLFTHKDIEELYHYRWNEEEAYKLLKCRIEVEDFSGKTVNAVKQDFFAKIFLMTLCAIYAHPIEEKVKAEYKADQTRLYDQKINRTNAIAATDDILIAVLIRKQYDKALKSFDQVVAATREIIRPGRSEPRNKKVRKLYSMNYKKL